MENYLYGFLSYASMMLLLWAYTKLNNHYQNHRNHESNEQKTQKSLVNRRKNHSEHTEAKGLYAKRSNPTVPPPNEFEMCGITEMGDPDFEDEMPFDAWLAVVEHQSFVEYLRMGLENNGILMQDVE